MRVGVSSLVGIHDAVLKSKPATLEHDRFDTHRKIASDLPRTRTSEQREAWVS